MMDNRMKLALAFAIAAVLALSGCTANTYVPCCDRQYLNDSYPDPDLQWKCIMQDTNEFGPCLHDADALLNMLENGTVNCSNSDVCAGHNGQHQACIETTGCVWNNASGTCEGGDHIMPVCVDDYPSSCVNGKCTAMMCGYANTKPSPPPASSDWNADDPTSSFSTADFGKGGNTSNLPSANLQATSCSFKTMNQKLYNEVRASKGSLWVNSFRFGIGKSFADWEAARNFFPASDYQCAANPSGTVDRFVNYVDVQGWCTPITDYYHCAATGMNFTATAYDTCLTFCQGNDCQLASGSKFECANDGFAYSDETSCQQGCSPIKVEGCTVNADAAVQSDPSTKDYPYLQGNGSGRYMMEYVTDYFIDVPSRVGKEEVCQLGFNMERWSVPREFGFTGVTDTCVDYELATESDDSDGVYVWSGWYTAGPWLGDLIKGQESDSHESFFERGKGSLWTWGSDKTLEASDNPDDTYNRAADKGARPYWQGAGQTGAETDTLAAGWAPDDSSEATGWSTDPSVCNNPLCDCKTRINSSNYEYKCSGTHPTVLPHKQSVIDFDYDFYENALRNHYIPANGYDTNKQLPFECSSSVECYSGVCDYTMHARGLCINTSSGDTVQCGCFESQTGGPDCSAGGLMPPTYDENGILLGGWFQKQGGAEGELLSNDLIVTAKLFDGETVPGSNDWTLSGSDSYVYLFLYDASLSYTPEDVKKMNLFLENCDIADGEDPYDVIAGAGPDAGLCYSMEDGEGKYKLGSEDQCVNLEKVKVYIFSFNSNNPDTGTCKSQGTELLDTQKLGWCDGCTYATLAVQNVTWPNWADEGYNEYMCYSWRGIYDYGPVEVAPSDQLYASDPRTYDSGTATQFGAYANRQYREASADLVRKSRWVGSIGSLVAGDPFDGPLDTGTADTNTFGEDETIYLCEDGWRDGQWWDASDGMPSPSAPYLASKLTSYLQSNIMPILDVRSSKPHIGTIKQATPPSCDESSEVCWGAFTGGEKCYNSEVNCEIAQDPLWCEERAPYRCNNEPDDGSGSWGFVTGLYPTQEKCTDKCGYDYEDSLQTIYNPVDVCTMLGGDGAVIYAVADTDSLASSAFDKGVANDGYIKGDGSGVLNGYLSGHIQSTSDGYELDGTAAAIYAATRLKSQSECTHKPLVAIAINGYENEAQLTSAAYAALIGDSDNADATLFSFFYKETQNPLILANKIANAQPDVEAGRVDLLLQTWAPMCQNGGATPEEKAEYEISSRMNFSRALLWNFAKPSLVWQFHFPSGSSCDKTYFLSYLFNHTGDLVDSGITGIIYDDWMTDDGTGYNTAKETYQTLLRPDEAWIYSGSDWFNSNLEGVAQNQHEGQYNYLLGAPGQPGTTNDKWELTTGLADAPLDEIASKGDAFCPLQKSSQEILGIVKNTIGQKLDAQKELCECNVCTEIDFATGTCKEDIPAPIGGWTYPTALNNYAASLPAQLYCNDGNPCALEGNPLDYEIEDNLTEYYCPPTCVNYDVCQPCEDITTQSSFCQIETPTSTYREIKPYPDLSDTYWEFLAGLPPKDKCCLSQTVDEETGKYTYASKDASSQRSEFLQFPRRGEEGIDCGRMPDTSILKYCNIEIPMSSRQMACWKIPNP